MRKIPLIVLILFSVIGFAQQQKQDSLEIYKKRVLEKTEIDFLTSYYKQDGINAAVTGGIGTEELTDLATNITIAIPLNDDDILTISATASAYTSASSSNGNPFDLTGASGDDDEDDDNGGGFANGEIIGSPWVSSSGASKSDTWVSFDADYSHSSDDRNFTWNANASFSIEYDYLSIGFGGGLLKQFNEKNTTLGLSANVFLDTWSPIYPTELKSYEEVNGNLNEGFFDGATIVDQNGNTSSNWSPVDNFDLIQDKSRNSFSASISFSQIVNKNAQISLFLDVVKQQGWLGNPMHRVYFGDIDNYYIGNTESIPNYTSQTNSDVFQLADDIERLPETRFKIPIGARFNYYINETFVARTYYRFYTDDWGVTSHTAEVELPIKISDKFTLYPSYRYYTQTGADYFAPFEQSLSTQEFYTSDYDLSGFNSNQFGFGIKYTDIFTKMRLWKFNLKSAELKYAHYDRSTGLASDIISLGFKYIFE
jgi:hypothetical protein